MTAYRLCLIGPTGRPVAVRRFHASTDEDATATARAMLADDPTLIGFDLWDGARNIAKERRRTGIIPNGPKPRRQRSSST